MRYDKPFLTYEEQINRLWSKYSITQSIDPRIDKTLLESISYYDLVNGYQDCFINNPDIKSLSLIDLFYFKMFDMNFQNILFKYSVFAENSFNADFKSCNVLTQRALSYPQAKARPGRFIFRPTVG